MQSFDQLSRYVFEDHHVRGELVQLRESYQQIIENHDYPAPIKKVLGELMAATSLLTATLKFEGEITVQLQGNGPVKVAVINANHQQELRGIARYDQVIQDDIYSLQELFGQGALVITVTPNQGERYQGVVPLSEPTVAKCLESYFQQSEQLKTRLWFAIDDEFKSVSGMLLQVLPVDKDKAVTDFDHLEILTDTVKSEEMLQLPAEELLIRLYHQENPQMFAPQPVRFVCGCSKERCESALISLGAEELEHIIDEQEQVDMHCEYCNSSYRFEKEALESLLQQLRQPN
ncbi:Hsp33 family molecular chaperone HslO [Algicola sagamiensis]|uniref:Hsp33 family molecular chaperone HslO n=1 Tax=Algicola sagamiensis TaxID=163869 RepID=UPI000361F481|nr:Hsp33 family molecular chaperone HslO [Algicola sagamiensis]